MIARSNEALNTRWTKGTLVGCLVSDKFLKTLIAVLAVCLAISLFFNGYVYWKLSEENNNPMHHSTFFSFVFGSAQQNISAGNLYLNVTFSTAEGNLTVKAEVNAENYSSNAFLALQFDSDNNGTIDIPEVDAYFYRRCDLQFFLQADNQTLWSMAPFWGWDANGKIYFGYMMVKMQAWLKSTFHFCTYNNGIYTFQFTFPIHPTEIALFGNGETGPFSIQGRLVRALFGVTPPRSMEPPEGMTVYVPPFNFVE